MSGDETPARRGAGPDPTTAGTLRGPCWHRVCEQPLLVLGFLALACFHTGLWRDLTTHVFRGPDPSQDVWIVNWVARHIWAGPDHIFDGNNYFPSRDAVLFCNPLLGPSVLVAPLRLVTSNPVFVYNAAVLASLTLASYGFYRLAFALYASRLAGVFAGVAIPYTSQAAAHFVHLDQMTCTGFPFILWSLLRLLDGGGMGWALGLGVAFALQAGTNGYHAWSVLVMCLIVGAWGWRRALRVATAARLLLAAAVATTLLAPYVAGVWCLAGEADMRREAAQFGAYSVDLATGWFQTQSYVWRAVWGALARGNLPVFPGAAVLVLAAVCVRAKRDGTTRLFVSIALVFGVLSLGPELRVFGRPLAPAPYVLLAQALPLFGAMRHPVTFAFPAMIALGVLAAGAFATRHLRGRTALGSLVVLFAFGETLQPRPARGPRDSVLPDVYRYLLAQPTGALLELPFEDHTWQAHSVSHGMRLVNGACGSFEPTRYAELWQRISHEWKRPNAGLDTAASVAFLKTHFPIRYLVVHANAPEAMRHNVEASPHTFTRIHETASGDRVYSVSRGGAGRRLRRAFRDDQLRGGPVRAVLRAARDASVRVSLNGELLGEYAIGPTERPLSWDLAPRRLQRGPNLLAIELVGSDAAAAFELTRIDVATDR